MKFVLALILAQDNPAVKPVPRDPKWVKRHEGFVEEAKKGVGELVFLGDSITDGWRSSGRETWQETFAPLKALNFGIGGDRTEHVLWRLRNGESETIRPKAVVLMIGTNNLAAKHSPDNTAAGIKAVVEEIRLRFPGAKLLLLGVFPRGEKPDNPFRAQIKAVNATVAKLDDGGSVKYLDIGEKFLSRDGTLPKEVMPDALHPNKTGYKIWAEAIQEPVRMLLQ